MNSMFDIFYQLESSDTVLVLDNLIIQTRTQSTRRTSGRFPGRTPTQVQTQDELDVRFDISGFIYRENQA